ncbi:hypothetical protein Tco_0710522 [Tanacetum coccineum]
MANMNTRLNIKKLDGNIVQKHGGSKQVGFKQLGPGKTGVHEIRVHEVQVKKRVWFEVELQGAQGNREAEVFQVSNDNAVVAQRRLDKKQLEEKTNTDCLVKEQKKEYQTGWKIKTGNVLDSYNQRSIQQCMKSGVAKHLGVAGIQQQNGLVNETKVTLFAKVLCFLIQSGLSKVFWAKDTTSIKQGMLEPVKVKSILLEYHKIVVGNKLWRFDDVTSKVRVQCRCCMDLPLGDHTFEVEHQENVDQGASLQEVQTQDLTDYQLARDRDQHLACELCGYREDSNEVVFLVAAVEKIYAHESLTFNNTDACEVISKWKAGLKDDMDARLDVYVLSNGCRKCSDDNDGYYWEYTLVQTLLEGHSILSLEGSLLGDCDVEKNGKLSCLYAVESQEYQVVCTRLDITPADVGMLDKFDRGLQTDVQVFVDFYYAIGRSIIIMGRSITRYEFMIQGCEGSLKANLLHMMALSTTEAGYMTFTEA